MPKIIISSNIGQTLTREQVKNTQMDKMYMEHSSQNPSPLEKWNSKIHWNSISFISNVSGKKCWWSCWEIETLVNWSWDFKLLQMLEINTEVTQKSTVKLPCDPVMLLLVIYSQDQISILHTDSPSHTFFIAALLIIERYENKPNHHQKTVG